ncbi:Oidioi.mRNA.OKI2018_I69.chr2.g7581.t1.cds [Oikopleura dioica]|uniref:Oidioi.mRNA.OKI2018_I69.chr2.g7581.t1.cds n=1 Tax=Oikopleura dioica TaxID=34765 RepID=A0ABN7T788_OIKDI|nr:Oidioi.mRNA.OKI2018_I69.chr2.g7581.t1.cds [Oikopleura dioica]
MYSRKLLSKSFQEAEDIRVVPLKRSSMTGSVEILSDIELCQNQPETTGKPRRKKLTRKVSSSSRFYECVAYLKRHNQEADSEEWTRVRVALEQELLVFQDISGAISPSMPLLVNLKIARVREIRLKDAGKGGLEIQALDNVFTIRFKDRHTRRLWLDRIELEVQRNKKSRRVGKLSKKSHHFSDCNLLKTVRESFKALKRKHLGTF